MTGGGRLAGIDVADNDDVDVSLILLTVDGSARARRVKEGSRRGRGGGRGATTREVRDIPHFGG